MIYREEQLRDDVANSNVDVSRVEREVRARSTSTGVFQIATKVTVDENENEKSVSQGNHGAQVEKVSDE